MRKIIIGAILFLCFIGLEFTGYIFFVGSASAGYKNNLKRHEEKMVVISKPVVITSLKINFQSQSSKSPVGWISDYGLPFGEKPGIFQTGKLYYGWKKRADKSPLDLSKNARIRDFPDDILLDGLVHMQANDIGWQNGMFKGTKVEGYWEIKVLNGQYDVVVTVGDGFAGKTKEKDCINIEGKKVIKDFVPLGKLGNYGRFKSVKARINVTDGFLTVTADGGINTKINNIEIIPVSIYPYVYLNIPNANLLVTRQDTSDLTLAIGLKKSVDKNVSYKLHLDYDGAGTNWLHLIADKKSDTDKLVFDYSETKKLPVGSYIAKISVSAPGFNSQQLDLQVRVVDASKPYVISSSPLNGSVDVNINTTSIAANNLHIPALQNVKGGIDNSTIKSETVKLFKESNGSYVEVKGVVQGTGGGDAISFSPSGALDPNSNYRFLITSNVKSYSGAPIERFESSFTTATIPRDSSKSYNVHFTKIPVLGTQNKNYTTLTFAPDGRLYALRMDGIIERYDVNHKTGELTGQKMINTLVKKYGKRTAIGLTFDPSSTPQNLIAWVTHCSDGLKSAPPFDGNISKLTGNDLSAEQLVITRLPRSTRDHMVNSVVFGPDKAMYIAQGSNSSAGAFDKGWQREESLLAGTILRLDLEKLKNIKLPLNVETTENQTVINEAPANSMLMRDGKYNPYSSKSPLTIYASGVRNAYDLIWHSNGQLYIPANGSGGGGNSPASVKHTRRPDGSFYNGQDIPATNGVQVQHDWLFRVNPSKPCGYFGHPNPLRGEYVVNRGVVDNPLYSQGVKPDKNYRPAAFDFGLNHSPNGVIEYKSNAFNGVLKGKLLVCRFSGGGDIMVLEPGSLKKVNLKTGESDHIYDIVNTERGSGNSGLTGMSGFANPLDLVEDPVNGNIYISEFNWNNNPNLISQITLLKVNEVPVKQYAIAKKQSIKIH